MTLFLRTAARVAPAQPKTLYENIKYQLISAIKDNDKKYVLSFVNSRLNVSSFMSDDIILLAVKFNRLDICRILLNHGANPNAMNGSLLAKAAAYGSHKMVELLLAKGADPNCNNGLALVNAVSSDNHIKHSKNSKPDYYKTAHILLSHGANPNTQNGKLLADLAKSGDYKFINLLCHFGADARMNNSLALKIAEESHNHKAILSLLFFAADSSVLKEPKHQQLVRFVQESTVLDYIQNIKPCMFLFFKFKSQEQKDVEYIEQLKRENCHSGRGLKPPAGLISSSVLPEMSTTANPRLIDRRTSEETTDEIARPLLRGTFC